MTPEELLAKHNIRIPSTTPGRYYTTCPECSGKRSKPNQDKPCLGVTIDEKGACWGCSHCGWTGPEKGNGQGGKFAQTYDYTDENGTLLSQKVRGYDRDGNKFFWQRRPDGKGGWINGTSGVRKVPYRLPELQEAIALGHQILLVEGEKDVDSAYLIGLSATCNPDGAAEPGQKPKWRREFSEMLRDADIIVIPDNDAAGRSHAEATASMSLGIAKRVRIFDVARHWPQCPDHGDLSDWLEAGHTREELDAGFFMPKGPAFFRCRHAEPG
jgi:hypothetical protein